MSDDTPIDRRGVAVRLGRSHSWLNKHLAGLQAQHGFPRPVPGLGGLFDPLAVTEWLARQRAEHVRPVVTELIGEIDWGALLDQRAASLRRGSHPLSD